MKQFLQFWYKFNEQFENYTKSDDSRLADRKLKAELDKIAKQNGVKIKGAANNDDLLNYAGYVFSGALAFKLVKHVKSELFKEASGSIKLGKSMYPKGFKNFSSKKAEQKYIDKLVNSKIDKTLWSDRIWSNMDALRSDLVKIMKQSLLTHQNPVTNTPALRDKYKVTQYQAERILRTESARITAQQSIDNATFNDYEKVIWVASSNACVKCSAHANKVYTLKKADGLIPHHPNCRCSWAAYVD